MTPKFGREGLGRFDSRAERDQYRASSQCFVTYVNKLSLDSQSTMNQAQQHDSSIEQVICVRKSPTQSRDICMLQMVNPLRTRALLLMFLSD